LKIFSGFIPDGLTFTEVFQPQILLFLAGLVVLVSGLAGIYPALVMTRFQPIMVLKKQVMQTGQTRGVWLRKVLTVSQFAIAQVLIIGTLIVNKQINYSLQKDMGFRKQAIVNFYVPFDFQKEDGKKTVLLNQLRTIPEIELASLGNQPPAFNGFNTTTLLFKDGKKELKIFPDSRCGDPSYIDLYHIKLLAGRNVLRSDSATELLINATMARQMGFQQPGDAVGKILEWDSKRVAVAGVMSDFNLASVRTSIHPAIFYSELRYGYVMHVGLRSDASTWPTALAKMKAAWRTVYPDKELDYSFLDANIERLYTQDRSLSKLLSWSAGIAIFIGCLGLLGLVIFTANRRAKEIGIRKILGATVTQIISLLSGDLIGLVGLGFLIAVPIGWWVMSRWLQDFAYHTQLSWWVFLLSGASMLAVALVILCIRAGRAALANPVDSLRNE
jgi:ABC-type antimicrobial peptide transport system permease subunit